MSFPQPGYDTFYEPRWPAVVEINISDEWRARWVDEQELPKDAPVDYGYVVVWMDDRGYVTRPAGEEVWRTVEGAPEPGEGAAAFVKRAAREQTGAIPAQVNLVGFLECKATSHNPAHPAGTIRVRPLYILVAKSMKDLGPGSPFERRRLPLNEHMAALRHRYPELETYLGKAAGLYASLSK